MKTNPNDPTQSCTISVYNKKEGGHEQVKHSGLTKREHFAAMAMQGLLSNNYVIEQYKPEYIAELAVQQVDFLIKALNKEEQ